MPDASRWERLVDPTHTPSPAERMALAGLTAASALYRLGATVDRSFGRRRAWSPPVPTICIGNITLGGSGKTTATRYLARTLLARGVRVAIVLRGYGRTGRAEQTLVHDGNATLATAAEVGDEAVMLATSLEHAAVLVGPSRVASARWAVGELGAEAIILDDGLQHWAIHPHLGIALWDATQLPSQARPFPRGRLREPLRTLADRDLVVLTRFDVAPEAERCLSEVRALRPERPVLCARHRPVRVEVGGTPEPCEWLAGRRVHAFSSLGNPRALRLTLDSLGAEVVGESLFPDHHLYRSEELSRVLEETQTSGAEIAVTTEKDRVKLAPLAGSEEVATLCVDLELLRVPGADDPGAWSAAVDRVLAPRAERET